MKIIGRPLIVTAGVVVLVGIFISVRSNQKNAKYYAGMADACEELLEKIRPSLTNDCEMAGDDPRLPKFLKSIRPLHVSVATNQVWLLLDVNSSGILWEKDATNPRVWRLTTQPGREAKTFFVGTNSFK